MGQKFKCVYSTADKRFLVGDADWVEPYGTPWDFFYSPGNTGLVEFCHSYPDRVLSGEIVESVFTANAIEELEKEIYYGAADAVKMLDPFGISYEPPKTDVYFGVDPGQPEGDHTVLDIWSAEAEDISPAYVPLREDDLVKVEQGPCIVNNKALEDMEV